MFYLLSHFLFFFFKQKTAYEMRISDWSSDVCSSDLHGARPVGRGAGHRLQRRFRRRRADPGRRRLPVSERLTLRGRSAAPQDDVERAMTDLFLRADSRAAMYAGLYAAGLMVEIPAAEAEGRATHAVEETVPGAEGEETVTRYFVPVTASHGWALDDAVLKIGSAHGAH